jgi:hypothetical protein
MAIELVPGQGLAFLNFEDPDDMIRKQEEAMAALNPPVAETAALAGDNAATAPTEFPEQPSQLQPTEAVPGPASGTRFER